MSSSQDLRFSRQSKFLLPILITVEIFLASLFITKAWIASNKETSEIWFETILIGSLSCANLYVILSLTMDILRLEKQVKICAWTKKINVEGRWLTIEEFLTEKLNLDVTHGITEELADQMISANRERSKMERSGSKTLE